MWVRSPRPRRATTLLVTAGFLVFAGYSIRNIVFIGPILALQVAWTAPNRRPTPLRGPVALFGGAAAAAALGRHVSKYRQFTGLSQEPVELVNFGESVNFPLLFAVALSVFGAATLLHLLLVSVASRRVEAGLLKALGFVRRQVAAAVCWQATVVALVGIAVGAPVGIATGKVLWRVFATNFGVVPVTVVEPVLIAALAVAVLAAANLLAAVPAMLAARSQPARLLRAE